MICLAVCDKITKPEQPSFSFSKFKCYQHTHTDSHRLLTHHTHATRTHPGHGEKKTAKGKKIRQKEQNKKAKKLVFNCFSEKKTTSMIHPHILLLAASRGLLFYKFNTLFLLVSFIINSSIRKLTYEYLLIIIRPYCKL
jgi:hypothetical protein